MEQRAQSRDLHCFFSFVFLHCLCKQWSHPQNLLGSRYLSLKLNLIFYRSVDAFLFVVGRFFVLFFFCFGVAGCFYVKKQQR